MFCPSCGTRQSNANPRYCSGCGMNLFAVSQFISNGGGATQIHLQANPKAFDSVRKKGLKQGGKMILAGLILVPTLGILTNIFGTSPFIVGLTALFTFWGGFLRMVYALIFEGNETETLEIKLAGFYNKAFRRQKLQEALPHETTSYSNESQYSRGTWRETSDLNFSSENFEKNY